MKLPITILAVLIFLMGGPLGLMQYHSRAAFIEPPAYPLSSTSPEPQITWASVGELLSDLMASRMTTLDCSIGSVGDLGSYYEAQRAKWFACLHNSRQTPGLIEATARAIARSWTRWQPTLVALPERLAELRDGEIHKAWRKRFDAYALAHKKAAVKADVASVQSWASAIGGSVVDRLGAFCDSHLPKWLADQLKPAPIPGLLAATANAIGKSGTKWQPTLVALPERLNELRKRDIFAIWQRRCESYAVAQFEAAAVARALPHYETDHAETSELVMIAETPVMIAETPVMIAEMIEPVGIIASRTPLPAAATIVLGTITSDLAIITAVPFGRVVADAISGLPSPTFRITKLAEPALWRPALYRAIGSFGQSRVQ